MDRNDVVIITDRFVFYANEYNASKYLKKHKNFEQSIIKTIPLTKYSHKWFFDISIMMFDYHYKTDVIDTNKAHIVIPKYYIADRKKVPISKIESVIDTLANLNENEQRRFTVIFYAIHGMNTVERRTDFGVKECDEPRTCDDICKICSNFSKYRKQVEKQLVSFFKKKYNERKKA